MKRLLFLLVISFSVVLVSCDRQAAAKYNNSIIGFETELVPVSQIAESQIQQYSEYGAWDSVFAVSKRVESRIAEVITKIDEMKVPDVTGANDFKQASERYFTYMKNIYGGYAKVAAEKTAEGREEERRRFAKMVDEKDQVIRTYQAAQMEFARTNNVKLQPAAN